MCEVETTLQGSLWYNNWTLRVYKVETASIQIQDWSYFRIFIKFLLEIGNSYDGLLVGA
jgi:hypothetical protein